MRTLLLRYGLKHHLSHRFRLFMVLLSLALGVAIFVSSYESVHAAQTAIAASAAKLGTSVQWEVSRGRYLGIEDSFASKFRQIPGAKVAPLIESTLTTGGEHPTNFLVIGADLALPDTQALFGGSFQGDPSVMLSLHLTQAGIMVAKAFAERNHLKEGSSLVLLGIAGPKTLRVVGVFDDKRLGAEAGGNIGLMELDQAALNFGEKGKVDKLEISGATKRQLATICPACEIDKPGKLGSAAEDALNRIRSLLGISVIALLVGVLLIYNSVQVSVMERMKDIAILRSIGATRNQIFAVLLIEWLVIGLIGSCFGLVIGSGLAIALVEFTKRTVNTMVPLVADAHVKIGPGLCVISLGIGVATALAAAVFPAWVASNVPPLEVLRPYSYRRSHNFKWATWGGMALFALSTLAVVTLSVSYEIGIGVTGLEFFGVALMFPQIVVLLGRPLRDALAKLKAPGPFLAIDGLLKAPHRTAFTIMTFGCALMMTVATKTLVVGFQASTAAWMTAAFPFDVSVMGNDLASSVYGSQTLRDGLTKKVRALPGVADCYAVRKLFTPYHGQDVMAIAVETDRYLAARSRKRMSAWPPAFADPEAVSKFKRGRGAFVSNNFARLYGIHTGQALRLDTPTGSVDSEVLGEVDDYSWQHGAFIIDLAFLRQRWKDVGVSYIDASIAPGYQLNDVKARIQVAASADRQAYAYDKAEIRKLSDSVLEQVVSMANLQAIIAIVIGVLGIVNAIWIGVMNRRREIALWRSIGVTKSQIYAIVCYEGLFIAGVAALVGVAGGLFGGWVPLRNFSFAVTGYLYPCVVPLTHVFGVIALALVLGLLAGFLPARQAANLPILDSIGYE